jgi:hypothetical protein
LKETVGSIGIAMLPRPLSTVTPASAIRDFICMRSGGRLQLHVSLHQIRGLRMGTYVLLACGFGLGLSIALWGIIDTLRHPRLESRGDEAVDTARGHKPGR